MSPIQPQVRAPGFLATIRLSSPVFLVLFVVVTTAPQRTSPQRPPPLPARLTQHKTVEKPQRLFPHRCPKTQVPVRDKGGQAARARAPSPGREPGGCNVGVNVLPEHCSVLLSLWGRG